MALPELSIEALRSLASEQALRRGREYCEGGAVSKVITSGGSYYANVYGQGRYSVRIWCAGDELQTSCTCHDGSGRVCRHIAAVMLAVLEGEGGQTPFNWYDRGRRVDREVADDVPEHDMPQPPPGRREAAGEERPGARPRRILAEEVMTGPVVTLTPDADLVDAWKLICEKRFRHVPVLSPEGALVGIVSDRDILLRAALISATQTTQTGHPGGTIREIMRTPVLTAAPGTEIRQIARVFFRQRIGAMPVVDERGRLVGMITRSDILRALIDHDLIWL